MCFFPHFGSSDDFKPVVHNIDRIWTDRLKKKIRTTSLITSGNQIIRRWTSRRPEPVSWKILRFYRTNDFPPTIYGTFIVGNFGAVKP